MCIKCFFLRVPPMLLILKQELRTILIKTTLPLRLHEGQFMAAVAEVWQGFDFIEELIGLSLARAEVRGP